MGHYGWAVNQRLYALDMQIKMRKASFSQVVLVLVDSPSGSMKMSTIFPTGNILKVSNNHKSGIGRETAGLFCITLIDLAVNSLIYLRWNTEMVSNSSAAVTPGFLLIPLQAFATVSLLIFYKVIQNWKIGELHEDHTSQDAERWTLILKENP